jgi:tripartite-type tricarboxylate transporter receptor subunit TctC
MRFFLTSAAFALGLAFVTDAAAQAYASKPIRIIVPFAPGGPNDILARLIAPKISEQVGQPAVIENRGGAAGTIGMEALSKLPGDGYSLGIGGSSNLAVAPSLYQKLAYNSTRDFTPIANLAAVPYALSINPAVPAKNVKELIAIAARKPRYLNYGSSGAGSMSSLAAEIFKYASKTEIVHVPYKGTAPALADVIAGQIDMMFADLGLVENHAKAGKLRVLGVSTTKRSATAPHVPTIAESGLPGYEVNAWFALVGPAGIPRDVVVRLNSIVAAALKSPDVLQRFQALGYDPIGGTPEELGAIIRSDLAKYAKIIKSAGIRIEQ